MQNLDINDGIIRLSINKDKNRVIEFNPNDVGFLERLYSFMGDVEAKEAEYMAKAEKLDENQEKDAYGIPQNTGASIELVKEICAYLRGKLDDVFGAGTSQTAFGDMNTLYMFEQFLDGVTPFIQNARTGATTKYTGNRAQRRAASKVMK